MSVISQIFVSLYVMCYYSLAAFKTFSLNLVFSSLTVICLCMVFFDLCFDWGSLSLLSLVIYVFLNYILGNFYSVFRYFSVPFLPSFPWGLCSMYIRHFDVPQFSVAVFIF